MRHFPTLLIHELRMLMVSLSTYVAGVLFLTVMGLLYFFVLYYYDSQMETELPSAQYFQLFWLPVLFMVPLLTMKSVAEERRLGTLEALLTTRASVLEIVLAKFGAAYLWYMLLWGLTMLYPWIAQQYLPIGRIDPRLMDGASLLGGYLFVAVSGLLYVALGLFASSLTRSTLVAGMLSFGLLFVLIIGCNLLAHAQVQEMTGLGRFQPILDYLPTFQHLADFSVGWVDTRPFFLYASNTLLVLGLTTLAVEARGGA
jgi:ABC-2 type transport system permease protein